MNFKITGLLSLILMPICFLGQQPASSPYPPVLHLSAEQDHQLIMDLLGMETIRRRRDGNSASPFAANYDESKANPYPLLPDPLFLANGKRVTTSKTWWTKRRPEIVELFDREIYGRVPSSTPQIIWTVISTERTTVGDVAVITRSLTGHVDNSSYSLIGVDLSSHNSPVEHVFLPR